MTSRTRLLVLTLTTPLVLFTVVGGLLGQQRTAPGSYPHLRVFDDVVSLIFGSYVEEPDADKVLDGAMLGLAEGLDPDSSYLDATQVKAIEADAAAPAMPMAVARFMKSRRLTRPSANSWKSDVMWEDSGRDGSLISAPTG